MNYQNSNEHDQTVIIHFNTDESQKFNFDLKTHAIREYTIYVFMYVKVKTGKNKQYCLRMHT